MFDSWKYTLRTTLWLTLICDMLLGGGRVSSRWRLLQNSEAICPGENWETKQLQNERKNRKCSYMPHIGNPEWNAKQRIAHSISQWGEGVRGRGRDWMEFSGEEEGEAGKSLFSAKTRSPSLEYDKQNK